MARPAAILAPSLLTGDFSRLGSEVAEMEAAGADRIHWDVMDGTFVPNLTFGPDVVASCRAHSTLPFEAHLMVADPDRLLSRWVEAGCERVIVHAEACTHLHRTLGSLKDLGAAAGVALNPATPPDAVAHVLDLVDVVLVMTVNPGFGGQRYLASMESKVQAVVRMAATAAQPVVVEVDGGISPATIAGAARSGADAFVSGSFVYAHPEGRQAALEELRIAAGRSAPDYQAATKGPYNTVGA
jgi:ribulose-phosphate 3-epimerase